MIKNQVERNIISKGRKKMLEGILEIDRKSSNLVIKGYEFFMIERIRSKVRRAIIFTLVGIRDGGIGGGILREECQSLRGS